MEGLVTTADGRAVAGARVGLVGMAEPRSTSDVDGRFRLSNLPAREFYRSYGFHESFRRKSYYQDGEDAFALVLTLAPARR